MVKTIVSPPTKSWHISRKIQLLVFQNGWSNLQELVGKDDCIVLMPVAIAGSAGATLTEAKGGQQTNITLEINSEVIITRRCLLGVLPGTKVVCVVLCIAKDKEVDKISDTALHYILFTCCPSLQIDW